MRGGSGVKPRPHPLSGSERYTFQETGLIRTKVYTYYQTNKTNFFVFFFFKTEFFVFVQTCLPKKLAEQKISKMFFKVKFFVVLVSAHDTSRFLTVPPSPFHFCVRLTQTFHTETVLVSQLDYREGQTLPATG